MSFDGNVTILGYNGNTAAAGVTGVARPARPRGAVFMAGFLGLPCWAVARVTMPNLPRK